MRRLFNRICRCIQTLKFYRYRKSLNKNVKQLKNKPRIKVLFVVAELGPWKTENLFLAMQKHTHFEPVLGICKSSYDETQFSILFDYVTKKGYDFIELEKTSIKTDIKPDIIFYQKPYGNAYSMSILYMQNLNSIFCHVAYSFNCLNEPWAVHNELGYLCWQLYLENSIVTDSRKKLMRNKGANLVCTGLPIMDELMLPKSSFSDPWLQLGDRKRIIYAPHHTIGDQHSQGINYSTFLEWGELILEYAKKYSKETQWAFKPHPLLRMKLYRVWDKKKVDNYYKEWEELENAQVELGKYEALFKYSDAMIHDCCSFQIEYHYTLNPVLFLVRDDAHVENMNEFSKKAFNLHYHAHTKDDIEQFIRDVICENDPESEKRKDFYKTSLLPPHGKTACENIINSILGIEEYANT